MQLFSWRCDDNHCYLFLFHSELKGSPYVFYSRGHINIKGLGDRQTYFVEPPSSNVKPQLEIVRHDSIVPILSIDEVEPTSIKKEDVMRSPSFVTYNKCTMVSTPSVQFIHTAPSNPKFETDQDTDQLRPDRISGEGLVMCRPSISDSAENTPVPTPRSSNVDLPETQIRKNKIAPNKITSRSELRPPPTIEEVSESGSGRTSRNSNNNSAAVMDVFISGTKNGTVVNGETPVAVAMATTSREQSMQENPILEHSDGGESSGSDGSNRRRKGKCVIS